MMFMTERVFNNLDLDYIFDRLTVYTPYGETAKKMISPYLSTDRDALNDEYDRIEKVVKLIDKHRYIFVEMRNYFKQVKDLRGSIKRIQDNEILSTVELFEMKTFMSILDKIHLLLLKLGWEVPKDIHISPIPFLTKLLDPQNSGVNTFYIYDEYSQSLSSIRKSINEIEHQLALRRLKARDKIQRELNIRLRPNGEITINKASREIQEAIEKHGGLIYSSETYMNITYRVKTDQQEDELLKNMEDLKGMEEAEEAEVRRKLTEEIKTVMDQLIFNMNAVGALDLLVAKAYLAVGMDGVRPRVLTEPGVVIQEGRHIKVEDTLRRQGKRFTPITLRLGRGVTCITGANMGGKTISLKLIGLLSAMAQYGLFVPAAEMEFSLKDFIFFSLGDVQSADMGLSTFGLRF